jgi:hypothetical protein
MGLELLSCGFASPIQPAQSRFGAVQSGLGDWARIFSQPVANQPITLLPWVLGAIPNQG